jgi:hypothetical protein
MRLRIVSVLIVSTLVLSACSSSKPDAPKLTELQRTKSGDMDVVLLAQKDAIPPGKSQATLEFQTGADHHLVDVGTVKVGASMEMAGMGPMLGSVFVNKSDTPGRYTLDTDLGMTGTWRLKVDWDGPAGTGSVTFPGTVR